MARRVYFSFHYQRDITRVNVVRNSWLTKPNREAAGFFDGSLWEEAKKKGDAEIRRMIENGLKNTSVTAILVGNQTVGFDNNVRKWIKYEIDQSLIRKNGLLAIRIHGIKNLFSQIDLPGKNPFDVLYWDNNGQRQYLNSVYPTYDWVINDGYTNFGKWVELAAQSANR